MLIELLLAAAPLVGGEDAARQAVICAETAFSRAAEQRDAAAFLTLVDPEARFVTATVLRGPAAVGAAWQAFFATDGPIIRWRPAIVEVVAGGTLAISRGPYRVTETDATGAARTSWGTFTSVWRLNADGRWKVLFDAGGDAGKTPSDTERAVLEAEPDCP